MTKIYHIYINNKFFSYFFYGILVLYFSSCTASQKIFINKDGSANISSSVDEINQMENFYKSDQISKLFWDNKTGINFTIKTIDSLGNYLSPVFNKNIFEFKYKLDSLIIIQRNGDALKTDDGFCCHSQIEITSEQKIKSIQTKNLYIKQKKNKVVIQKSRRSFKKKERNLNLIIIFE